MKIRNFELINILNELNNFSEKKLPQTISFAIVKNLLIAQKQYECYTTSLQKILHNYEQFIDESKKEENNNLPRLINEEQQRNRAKDIEELLNIQIDISFYQIPEESFSYNDERYDILTVKEILFLQQILCNDKVDE